MLERRSFEKTHVQCFARNTEKTGKAANGKVAIDIFRVAE